MSYEVIVSSAALEQLWESANWYYERSGSIEVALTWHDGFLKAFESLSENPHQFGLAAESSKFSYELRQLLYGSGKRKTHRALFRIDGNRIEVLAIRHHAQRDVTPDDLQ